MGALEAISHSGDGFGSYNSYPSFGYPSVGYPSVGYPSVGYSSPVASPSFGYSNPVSYPSYHSVSYSPGRQVQSRAIYPSVGQVAYPSVSSRPVSSISRPAGRVGSVGHSRLPSKHLH